MADDLVSALRSLANRWALKARDYSRDAKAPGVDADTAAYNRGYAEGYYRAATELADLIKAQPATPAAPPRPAQPARPAPQPVQPVNQQDPQKPNPNAGGRWLSSSSSSMTNVTPTAPSASQPAASSGAAPARQGGPPPAAAASDTNYELVDVNEVLVMLQYAGTTPRDLQLMTDNSFHAVFSKWENMTAAERHARVQKADLRLVIIGTGVTKETRDPFIDFAFKSLS